MNCRKPGNVDSVLIGLHHVGVVGLWDAIRAVDASGLANRERIASFLFDRLRGRNYFPPGQADACRAALLREYLRFKGEDFSDYFSEIVVTVRSPRDGRLRATFVERLQSVLSDFELRAEVTYQEPAGEMAGQDAGNTDDRTDVEAPELWIEGERILRGLLPREEFKAAIRQRISEW